MSGSFSTITLRVFTRRPITSIKLISTPAGKVVRPLRLTYKSDPSLGLGKMSSSGDPSRTPVTPPPPCTAMPDPQVPVVLMSTYGPQVLSQFVVQSRLRRTRTLYLVHWLNSGEPFTFALLHW